MKLDIPMNRTGDLDVLCDAIVEQTQIEAYQSVTRERFSDIVKGLRPLNEQDRLTVINYLRQDDTIAQITGDDPDMYYQHLCDHNKQVSNELLVYGVAFALAAWFLHKYRDTFFALRRSLADAAIPEDTWLETNTSTRLVLTYDAFKQNDTMIENAYKALRVLLSKKDPQDADFRKVMDALHLKVPASRSTGDVVVGGAVGFLAGLGTGLLLHLGVTVPIVGLLLISGMIPLAMITTYAGVAITTFASWFVIWRVGSNVSNKARVTFASQGWSSDTVKWARERCIAQIKNMDDLIATMKSVTIADDQKQKAVKKLAELLAEGVKGLCISTARILR